MEIEVINGVEWKRWHFPNGQLECEIPHVDGKIHGLCQWRQPNGRIWNVQLMNNGRLVFEIENPPKIPGKWKLK